MTDIPKVNVYANYIQFSDGTTVSLKPGQIIVLVGANNCGKSSTLRGINQKFSNPEAPDQVVKSLSLIADGSLEDFVSFVESWALSRPEGYPDNPVLTAFNAGYRKDAIVKSWKNKNLHALSGWFCRILYATDRIQLSNPAGNIQFTRENPSSPIQWMARDEAWEEKISAAFSKAFGADLVVHRNAGNMIPLYVGKRPERQNGEDRSSLSYSQKIEALPPLEAQGDGMRSFAGMILSVAFSGKGLLLIDEPEAFLHPPQARLLGKILAREMNGERQLFLATHSADMLHGLLDEAPQNIQVIRLERQGDVNVPKCMDSEKVKTLWSDPLLRYSNIFDGLFYERVVICEGDSDCRFYSAILEHIVTNHASMANKNVMFTHCGGKQRVPMVVGALRDLGVPVRTIVDFDILSDKNDLKKLTDCMGLDWTLVDRDFNVVSSAIAGKRAELSTSDVKREISAALETATGEVLSTEIKGRIQNALKRSNPWAHAKEVGKAFVPNGDQSVSCERLLKTLEKAGIHVVPCGQLESFDKTSSDHGSAWVNQALSKPLDGYKDAIEFVQAVCIG